VDVTETPAKDLTAANLAKYDVLLLNYKDTRNGPPDTRWSDDNKRAFTEPSARQGPGGLPPRLVRVRRQAATSDKEIQKVIAGGWRKQGNHGKSARVQRDHPPRATTRSPRVCRRSSPTPRRAVSEFAHAAGQRRPGHRLSDKTKDPKNTDKHEPVVWVARYARAASTKTSLAMTSRP